MTTDSYSLTDNQSLEHGDMSDHVVSFTAEHKINRIDELLPWRYDQTY
jgi:hypothetical protein